MRYEGKCSYCGIEWYRKDFGPVTIGQPLPPNGEIKMEYYSKDDNNRLCNTCFKYINKLRSRREIMRRSSSTSSSISIGSADASITGTRDFSHSNDAQIATVPILYQNQLTENGKKDIVLASLLVGLQFKKLSDFMCAANLGFIAKNFYYETLSEIELCVEKMIKENIKENIKHDLNVVSSNGCWSHRREAMQSCYCVINYETRKIIAVHVLMKSRKCEGNVVFKGNYKGKSQNMEYCAFKKCYNMLKEEGVLGQIQFWVTDQHSQITKFLKNNIKEKLIMDPGHYFKSLKKYMDSTMKAVVPASTKTKLFNLFKTKLYLYRKYKKDNNEINIEQKYNNFIKDEMNKLNDEKEPNKDVTIKQLQHLKNDIHLFAHQYDTTFDEGLHRKFTAMASKDINYWRFYKLRIYIAVLQNNIGTNFNMNYVKQKLNWTW